MPKDLLPDLIEQYGPASPLETSFIDLDKQSYLNVFFTEVQELRNETKVIVDNTAYMRRLHSQILSSPSSDEESKKKVEILMADTYKIAQNVRKRLSAIGKNISAESIADPYCAEHRIKKIQHSTITNTFTEAMQQYNLAQTDFRDMCKAKIKRQFEIADKPITDDELDSMLENNDVKVFTSNIMSDTEQAKQTLADIEARHADLIKLEKSIKELSELFSDMALLVESQGDLVDKIDYNVNMAKDYVAVAKTETAKAVVYQSKARKKKIILAIIAIVVVLIIVIIIAVAISRSIPSA